MCGTSPRHRRLERRSPAATAGRSGRFLRRRRCCASGWKGGGWELRRARCPRRGCLPCGLRDARWRSCWQSPSAWCSRRRPSHHPACSVQRRFWRRAARRTPSHRPGSEHWCCRAQRNCSPRRWLCWQSVKRLSGSPESGWTSPCSTTATGRGRRVWGLLTGRSSRRRRGIGTTRLSPTSRPRTPSRQTRGRPGSLC
jgi:hypothetical protein